MRTTIQTRFKRATAAFLALAVILSVLGPVGMAAAAPSVSVSQQADSTTVNPGDTVTVTTDFSVTELNAPQLSATTPAGWAITDQSAEGPAAYNGDGTWTWLAGDNDGVDVSYIVEYTVQVPEDASPGEYTIDAEGSALSPSDSTRTADTDALTITVEEEQTNTAPTADAGTDQTVDEGSDVTLDASGSSDADGDALSYSWTETSDAGVSLADADTATPTFTAPSVDSTTTLTFEVTVADGNGGTDTDTVSVTVEPVNEDPTASISGPTSAQVGEELTFEASASDDGSIASYEWDFGDGETATGQSVTHTFDAAGDYAVELTVTDDDGATATATQTVAVSAAPDPASFQITNLDAPASATQGDTVTVEATVQNAGDEEATQTVAFAFDGSQVDSQSLTLDGGESDTVSFTLDTTGVAAGTYTHGVSTDDDTASAQITVEEPAPEPDPASFDLSNLNVESPVTQGDTATVTATVENSGDEQATQTVTFDLDGSQADSQPVSLAGGASQQVSFDVDTTSLSTGDHTVAVATDDDSASGTMTIEAASDPAPGTVDVSLVPADQTATTGEEVTYDVVVSGTDDVGAFDGTVTLSDTSSAVISDVSTPASDGNEIVAVGDQTAEIEVFSLPSGTDDPVTVATITLSAESTGETDISLSDTSVFDEQGSGYTVDSTSGATLSVGLDPIVGDTPPANMDDDEVLEDINGNGEFNIVDVQALFYNQDSQTVQNNVAKFDFNGDGEINVGDVQAAFYEAVLSQ